jgi:hypothetical protein
MSSLEGKTPAEKDARWGAVLERDATADDAFVYVCQDDWHLLPPVLPFPHA